MPQDSTAGDTNDLPSVEAIDVKTVLHLKKIVMLYVFLRFFGFSERFYYKNVRITVTQKILNRAAAIDTLNNIL